MAYLRKVSEIMAKGESLGNPSRELVIETLDKHPSTSKATQEIREDYRREISSSRRSTRATRPRPPRPPAGAAS